MNIDEIRAQFPPVAIWMADATIREARRAITGNTGWQDVKRSPYNLPEVEMAGEVLFRMFNTYSAAIKTALLSMPEKMDGLLSFPDKNYFDVFVNELCKKDTSAWRARKADWILEKC